MILTKKNVMVLFSCFISQCCFAVHDSSVTITLFNNSKNPLVFINAVSPYTENSFTVNPATILPGYSGTITGTTAPGYDLIGQLFFDQAMSGPNSMIIDDFRQIRLGQPIFSMNTELYTSTVLAQSYNPQVDPEALTYVEASVVVNDRDDKVKKDS